MSAIAGNSSPLRDLEDQSLVEIVVDSEYASPTNGSPSDSNEPIQIDFPSCNQIRDRVLRSSPLEEMATIADVAEDSVEENESEAFDPEKFYTYFTHEIINPQPYHKTKRAFDILASAEKFEEPIWAKTSVINSQVWDDLNLLYGSSEKPAFSLTSILSTVGETSSEIGKAYLSSILARPIVDIETLRLRQNTIRRLMEDRPLFNQLKGLLTEFAKHETMLTGLWGKEQLMQFIKAEEYFATTTKSKRCPRLTQVLGAASRWLNKSSVALDAKSAMGKIQSVYGHALTHLTPALLLIYGGMQLSHATQPQEDVAAYTDVWMNSRLLAPTLGTLFSLVYLYKNRVSQGLAATAAGTAEITGIQRAWKQFLVAFKYDLFLKNRLTHVAECLRIMKELNEAVPDEMKQGLTFFKHIDRILSDLPQTNSDFKSLLEILNGGTFSRESFESSSQCFRRGPVLSAYRMLDRLKTHLTPAIAAVGEIDTFLTLSQMMQRSENSSAKYCFPTYLDSRETPTIVLNEFWNNFLDPEKVVTNSVGLGIDAGVPHMIVTGPNSGGKSTIVCKGIPMAVILAQSIGIAPATEMSLTPFSHIAIYANISDSIVDQESRFQREARRAFEHGEHIEKLSYQGDFSLAVFDEVFSGTSPEEGAEWGYRVAKGFSTYRNCICLLATHFKRLTELERDGEFVNFKVSIGTDENGDFIREENRLKRTYTLTRGIANQQIAAEVLREQGYKNRFFERHFLGQ